MNFSPIIPSRVIKSSLLFTISIAVAISISSKSAKAQALDQFDTKKGFTLGGSVGLNTIAYAASGTESRRDPFDMYLMGSLNLGIFGYSLPLSFSYSNRKANFTQPFNTFQLAPSYKWAKAYIGTSSMSFSNYTLAGHQFSGAGVELTPGKWAIAAMYGRLKKAVAPNYDDPTKGEPSYKRTGYGAKVGYTDGWGMVGANFLYASDDVASLGYIPTEAQLNPLRNTAVGLTTQVNLLKHFYVGGEYSLSILSTLKGTGLTTNTLPAATSGLSREATEQLFNAISAGVGYQASWIGLRLNYERVDPNYQTLGGYFFTNDMENYTIMPNLRLLDGKLSMNGNVGLQRDNLSGIKDTDTKRFVGSANVNYTPSETWNFFGSYSNFNSYTRRRLQADPTFQDELDSLNFYQVSQSLAASAGYTFGSKEQRQGIALNLSYQASSEEQKANPELGTSGVYTGSLSYTYTIAPSNFSASAAGNITRSDFADTRSLFIGPSVNLSKGVLKNLIRSSWGISYSYNSSSGSIQSTTSSVLMNRLNISFAPKPKDKKSGRHNAGLSFTFMQRFGTSNTNAFRELTSMLNYTYSF